MLGAAQGGVTVGLNFQAWYYDSGSTPQAVGYGSGYQTTGFPVTARAFGVETNNWFNTDPLDCRSAISTSVTFAGSLTAQLSAPNAWQSGIGELVAGWHSELVTPGNDEVTWGYLDDGNKTGQSPSASVSGLVAKFPHGYVVQTITANAGVHAFDGVDITDGVTTNAVAYSTYYVVNPASDSAVTGGTVGLSAQGGSFTSDTINLYCHPKTASNRSVLAGFIITDQPVVSLDPANTGVNAGSSFTLSAGVIGLSPLAYQWQHAGTNIPGATFATYTNTAAAANSGGAYQLVATNVYGATTSLVATVTVALAPSLVKDLAGVSGMVYSGGAFSRWSVLAAGAMPLQYNWLKNGATPVGSNSPTLTLNSVTPADSGAYSVTITNGLGSVKSATNHLTVVAAPNLYATDVAQDMPGGYWPLAETSGANAFDYSGAGNTGTNNGSLTLGATGPRPPAYAGFEAGKTAYQFDGTSSYVQLGTGPSLSGTTDFTLEAWVNTTATAQGSVIQQRDHAGYNGEYELTVNASGMVSFMVYGGGYQFNNFSSPNAVNDGKWHHIAAVRSGTNGAIYIDGNLAASQTSTTVAPLDPTIQTYIGADMRDSVSYFNGLISDVAIYSVALPASRIGLHAYNGLMGAVPVTLQIVTGGWVVDSKPSGTPHLGVNYGAAWLATVTDSATTPVTRNGVEQFSGAAQIVVPADPDFNSAAGTICFWMRAPLPAVGKGTVLVDRLTTQGLIMYLDGAPSGGIDVQYVTSAGTNYIPTANSVVDNNWHHVALIYDQSTTGAVSLFVDGVNVGGLANPAAWSWPASQEIELGRSHDSSWQSFKGQIDDFRIYSTVLSDAEIAALATPATSDSLPEPTALKARYTFDTAGVGGSLTWPFGSLQSSPKLGPSASWTTVTKATSPYPFLPPSGVTNAALFYRVAY